MEFDSAAALQKITIVGGGQMGTSTALSAKMAYPDAEIVVLDVDPTLSKDFYDKFKAEDVSADRVTFSTDASLCTGSDLIVLATPISQFSTAIEVIAPHVTPDTILTDIGSVKELSIKRIKKALKKVGLACAYVPFHILNGNAGAGPSTGSKTVYNGAPGVLVPDHAPKEAENVVYGFFKKLGTRMFKMEACKHDTLLGTLSHLEYVAMFAFMETPEMQKAVVSDGMQDPGSWIQRMTRIADAGPEMWAAIFGDNKKKILASAECLRDMLLDVQKDLEEGRNPLDKDGEELHRFANTTLDASGTYTKERPNFLTKPFDLEGTEEKDLSLSALAAVLSYAITKNGKRVQDETGQLLFEIANPSFKDGLGPMAVAPETAAALIERYKDQLPQMIDTYISTFEGITRMIRGLDPEGPSTDDKNRPTYGQNCRDALKKLIVSISNNRRNLPRAFSRTLQRFGERIRAGHLFNPQLACG